jgi:hypothetical protein
MTVLIDIGLNRYAHEFKDVFKRLSVEAFKD